VVQNPRIVAVEWAVLEGARPRPAGSNARRGAHGSRLRVPILRLTTDDGARGFGAFHGSVERLAGLPGLRLADLFDPDQGVREPWLGCEYPIWDLVGQLTGQPVYALAGAIAGVSVPPDLHAPCYDTSLYFDDLHLGSTEEAAALIAAEAREGYERGHRAFKIKVGRGARHLPLAEGTARDIAVVRAVRAAVGVAPAIMLDANNGYNLNLTRHVLAETAACDIFWIEEPFQEDDILYQELRAWLTERGLALLIADGEGQADPRLVEWATQGLVDVVQYDIFAHGFTRWLQLGRTLDAAGVRSAPHHYGGHYGNYAACHLAGAIRRFSYVEWDEGTVDGLDTSGYTIHEGRVALPRRPGFGLDLDEDLFQQAIARTGGRLAVGR
jgi:L-rhamnonate dehydratase